MQILFLGVLGVKLELPNATIVTFGDMACGRAIGLARAAFMVISVVMVLFLFYYYYCVVLYIYYYFDVCLF